MAFQRIPFINYIKNKIITLLVNIVRKGKKIFIKTRYKFTRLFG